VTGERDFLVQAQTDVELRRIFLDANLVLCDGTPLVWHRDYWVTISRRVAGGDIVPLLIQVAANEVPHLLLEATPDSAQRAVDNFAAAVWG